MKKIYIITFVLIYFLSFQNSLAQNRYSNLDYSKSSDLDFYNPIKNLELIDNIISQRYEKAILDCYELTIKKFRELADKGEAEFDYMEPNSSWIKRVEYYHVKKTGLRGCLLFTKDNQYLFRMKDEIWEIWKETESKGEFFNRFIRDNAVFSFRPFCEVFIQPK